jgi:MYXO-CTERM domain-containing protein
MASCLAIEPALPFCTASSGTAPRSTSLAQRRAELPLRFEANTGQLDPAVRFIARAKGLTAFLTDDGAALRVGHERAPVTLRVRGDSHTRQPRAEAPLATRSSYFIGNDPARWRTDVPSFGRVTYTGVAAGVDEVFHGDGSTLEYDFVVAPGASPRTVDVAFDGADRLTLDAEGALSIRVGRSVLVQPRPRVYQRVRGQEVAVAGGYRLTGRASVAFDVGAYDTAVPLIIDPVLAYATYLGGSGDDYGYGIAVDGTGAMYITGFTTSIDFPTRSPYQAVATGNDDVFVAKLDPTGTSLVYATYIGGDHGAYGYAITVDSAGSAYVVGATDSTDFPATGGFQRSLAGGLDAFVVKLAPTGSALTYATYLGGSSDETGYGVALDAAGEAFVTGTTSSSDLRTHTGVQPTFGGVADAFLAKLDASGDKLVYATFLGGSQEDEARGVAVDASGAAYVAGFTSSPDFATAAPFQALENGAVNAFVAKVDPSGGSLAYATYLGGSEVDMAGAIAVDGAGAAYVTGSTTSFDFPTKAAYQHAPASVSGGATAFVTKLDATGAALVYSTYLGGTGGDVAHAVAVTAAGDAVVAGATGSTDFPTLNAPQATNNARANPGGTNAFVTELDATGATLVYSTYVGGSLGDSATAIALGVSGDAYVTGYTTSPDFPTVAPLQAALASVEGDNAFVVVLGSMTLTPDAGVVGRGPADAGHTEPPSFDAASVLDASEPVPAEAGEGVAMASGDGCACGVGRRSRGAGGGWLAVGLGLGFAVRRRRSAVGVAISRDLP